jgi:hypothetical protein
MKPLFGLSGLFLWMHCLSCKPVSHRQVEQSFYYWRTVFDPSAERQETFHKEGLRRIYLRFFDVVSDKESGQAVPAGDLRFETRPLPALEFVPVVYITTDALRNTPDSNATRLAQQITNRIAAVMLSGQMHDVSEIQIDCDWTPQTRDKYFNLLRALRKLNGKMLLSATIRLHQLKYAENTGVPPVDRGMLMFYNMGRLADPQTENSIYDKDVAASYLKDFNGYALPLDIALPCFSWAVVMLNGHVTHLLKEVNSEELASEKALQLISPGHFKVMAAMKLHNVYLFKNETVRLEEVSPAQCVNAAKQIAPYLRHQGIHVAVFDLKKKQYSPDEKKDFQNMYRCFE